MVILSDGYSPELNPSVSPIPIGASFSTGEIRNHLTSLLSCPLRRHRHDDALRLERPIRSPRPCADRFHRHFVPDVTRQDWTGRAAGSPFITDQANHLLCI